MPTSKHRKNHKAKVVNYKQSNKPKTMSEQQPQGLPEVRQRPYWNSHDTLEISGLELEYIYNSFAQISNAVAALNSVLNNNLVKGKIEMGFEKLVTDPAGTPSYVAMSDAEQAPLKAEFEKMLAAAKQAADTAVQGSIIHQPSAEEVKDIVSSEPKKRGRKPKLEIVK